MATARGRHAPPLEVRVPLQRERLLDAAALEFAEHGYSGTSSQTISRRAQMSKATFYQHFANKEECMLALYEVAVTAVQQALIQAAAAASTGDPSEMVRAGVHAFLGAVAERPEYAQTLLVEIIGAGPRGAQRRDELLQSIAGMIETSVEYGAAHGMIGRFGSPHDAYAAVGAIAELVSRQVRLGVPETIIELGPVVDRLLIGLLGDPPTPVA